MIRARPPTHIDITCDAEMVTVEVTYGYSKRATPERGPRRSMTHNHCGRRPVFNTGGVAISRTEPNGGLSDRNSHCRYEMILSGFNQWTGVEAEQ